MTDVHEIDPALLDHESDLLDIGYKLTKAADEHERELLFREAKEIAGQHGLSVWLDQRWKPNREGELDDIAMRLRAHHAEQCTEALDWAERDAVAERIFELSLAAEEIVGKENLDSWLDENVPGLHSPAPVEAPDAHVKLRTPETTPAETQVGEIEQAAEFDFIHSRMYFR